MDRRARTGILFLGVLAASISTATFAPSITALPAAHAASGLGAGGEYHPLAPTRIFDTRASGNAVATVATSPAGGTADVGILGLGGIPADASGVLAVAVSITVVNPTRDGYLQVYPSGTAAGLSSVLNFAAGQTVPNLSVLTVGANGKVTVNLVTTANGTADVLVDVFGWFSTSNYATAGARLIPVAPGRIYDSRDQAQNAARTTAPLGTAALVTLPIRGADAQNPAVADIVPNSPNVVGVVLNVTGIDDNVGSTNTFVSVLPEDPVGQVTTSNLNLSPGQVKANLVIVPVTNADGAVRLYNNAGQTHVAVDVVGYMLANQDPAMRLGRVVPLTAPFRALDTRDVNFGNVQLGPTQAESWSFSQFVGSVTLGGAPVGNQIALLGNLTGTGLTRASATTPVATYFTLYPDDVIKPFSSNINVTEGANVPNMAVVKLGADNGIKAYNNGGYIHYVFDVSAVVLGQ